MKVIIAGSRTVTDYSIVEKAVKDSGFEITEVISGGAKGVDTLGEKYSKTVLNINPKVFRANWKDLTVPNAVIKQNTYGKYNATAGHNRNQQMADYGDALIVIIKNNSSGSKDMLKRMIKLNKPIYKVEIK